MSVVYFIQSDIGLIKIGTTTSLVRRLNAFRTATDRPLVLLKAVPGEAA